MIFSHLLDIENLNAPSPSHVRLSPDSQNSTQGGSTDPPSEPSFVSAPFDCKGSKGIDLRIVVEFSCGHVIIF